MVKLASLRAGMSCLSVPSFVPDKFLQHIQENRIERLYVVPPIILFLSNHPIVSKYDVSSLRYILSGAAPLTTEAHGIFQKKYPNIKLKQGTMNVVRRGDTILCVCSVVYSSMLNTIASSLPNFASLIHSLWND
jgi:acyl-CoA synthetase (AMP-forming)/AMP-acid ligase II